ncbi:MAG: nucleotidyl transferase AbiEii/AbiGii toxin family protein [Elusimicrobiota bacterium]
MLSENTLKELTAKYQTTEINVAREYFQHSFLANLYRLKEAEKIAFKGGTALRIIYGSPRFSEDLDFTADIKIFHLKEILDKTIKATNAEGLNIKTLESKETSGGYIAIYETVIHTISVRVELNISLRQKGERIGTESHLIVSPMHPAYSIVSLNEKYLAKEKVEALISRNKSRDVFDLYFIIKNRIAIDAVIRKQKQLSGVFSGVSEKTLTKELKYYLPKSYWKILRNLSEKLLSDIKRL